MAHAASALHQPHMGGKTSGQENFPVASFLLPRAVRRQVMAFYRFARLADDVADHPALSADEKLRRLDCLHDGLRGRIEGGGDDYAHALRQSLHGQLHLLTHAEHLLQAFRRDVMVDSCHDWADLMAYCRFSAMPVGRFLLDLHGEDRQTHAASDCLCAALQILNHLQDCAQDYRSLGRVYLPQDWLRMEGLDYQSLAQEQCGPELRRVLDKTLDHVDGLLDMACPLPSMIHSRGLRMETSTIIILATHLAQRLRDRDPLTESVGIPPLSFVWAMVKGIWAGYLRRQ